MKRKLFVGLIAALSCSMIVASATATNSIGEPKVSIFGETAKISIPVKEVTEAKNTFMLASFFDLNDVFLGAANEGKTLLVGDTNPLEMTVNIPSSTSKVQAMLWNTNCSPLTTATTKDPEADTDLDLSATESTYVKVGSAVQLLVNGYENPVSGITYTSSAKAIATVSDTGVVTGVDASTAVITASYGGKTRSLLFTITDADITTNGYETASESTAYARSGEYSHQLTATQDIYGLANLKKNGVMELWFYDDGEGVGKRYNATNIFQIYGSNGGTTVNEWVWFDTTNYCMEHCGKATISANKIARSVGWHQMAISAGADKAIVYIDGKVLGTINYSSTATDAITNLKYFTVDGLNLWIDDLSAAQVYVKGPDTIDLSQTPGTVVAPDGYRQIYVNGEVDVKGVTFTSSDEAIATVNPKTGMVHGISKGLVTITATSGTVSKKIMFTVTNGGSYQSANYEGTNANYVEGNPRTGNKSYYAGKTDTMEQYSFIYPNDISNGAIQFWFYDNMEGGLPSGVYAGSLFNIFRRTSDQAPYKNFNAYLSLRDNGNYGYMGTLDSSLTNYSTNKRTKGWHQFTVHRYDTYVDIYVDGVFMCRTTSPEAGAGINGVQWQSYNNIEMWVDDCTAVSFE